LVKSLNTGLSQEKFDQLVSLLQQSNLLAQTSTSSGSVSNHVSVSLVLTAGRSPTQSSAGNHSIFSFFLLNHPIFGFWLIGYGAIDHRCSSLQYFSSFYSIKIVRVSLANGTSVIVNYAGNVHFFLH